MAGAVTQVSVLEKLIQESHALTITLQTTAHIFSILNDHYKNINIYIHLIAITLS